MMIHRTRRLCYNYKCASPAASSSDGGPAEWRKVVLENAVVVFAQRGCCMSQVVRHLLQSVGANPTVCEVEAADIDELAGQLAAEAGGGGMFPAVFVGGRWFGGTERVIATLIKEELIPLLKKAGALWL